MLNTHDRTTLRCNHRMFHHDFETALDHDDGDDDKMMMMMMMMMMRVNQLTVCQNI